MIVIVNAYRESLQAESQGVSWHVQLQDGAYYSGSNFNNDEMPPLKQLLGSRYALYEHYKHGP